jgi:hypothetical protein
VARSLTHKEGAVFERWTLVTNLGVGGNGEAWRVRSEAGEIRVIKLLHPGAERYERFKREVIAMKTLAQTGFPALPIEHARLPDHPSKGDPAYYVMPEAIPIAQALAGMDVRSKTRAVQQFAVALAMLLREHKRNHRDVKPANLYEYEGRFVLGDLGLTTDPDPEAASLTSDGRALGPWAFLPSEVFNPPPDMEIDREKVDVYCLAMSLWCLIKESDDPPRRIEPHGPMSLTRQLSVPSAPSDPSAVEEMEAAEYRQHIGELDAVLAAATADDPDARPTLQRFAEQLSNWEDGIKIRSDVHASIIQSEADESVVLRWLVSSLRDDRSLGLNVYDVSDATAPSPVDGLSCGRFSDALDGLTERYHAVAERFPERGSPRDWSNVYPTGHGIELVERTRVEVETLPLLRALLRDGAIEMLSFSGADNAVKFGETVMPGPELYFLLRYMKEASLIDFDQDWEMGPGVIIMHLTLTRHGRNRVTNSPAARVTPDDSSPQTPESAEPIADRFASRMQTAEDTRIPEAVVQPTNRTLYPSELNSLSLPNSYNRPLEHDERGFIFRTIIALGMPIADDQHLNSQQKRALQAVIADSAAERLLRELVDSPRSTQGSWAQVQPNTGTVATVARSAETMGGRGGTIHARVGLQLRSYAHSNGYAIVHLDIVLRPPETPRGGTLLSLDDFFSLLAIPGASIRDEIAPVITKVLSGSDQSSLRAQTTVAMPNADVFAPYLNLSTWAHDRVEDASGPTAVHWNAGSTSEFETPAAWNATVIRMMDRLFSDGGFLDYEDALARLQRGSA